MLFRASSEGKALVSHFGWTKALILDWTFGKELDILFNKLLKSSLLWLTVEELCA